MPSATKTRKPASQEADANKELQDMIREQVLARLGKPDDLEKISVTLFESGRQGRVNIFRRINAANIFGDEIRITDSFFVKVSNEGVIISSAPVIDRKY